MDGAIRRNAQSKGNLCSRCWHDCAQRCVCEHLSHLQTALPAKAKVLVLMHHKEYLNAGDNASSPCSLQANANPTPTPTPLPLSLTLSLSLSFALT